MGSPKQHEANQRNALGSTGPRTVEGKAKVSKNATKHGLLSREVVMEGESQEAFKRFRGRLMADLAPEGETECLLADRVAAAVWRLRRVVRIEREMMEADLVQGVPFGPKAWGGNQTLGRCVANDLAELNTYGKFARYEAHIERGLYRALHELQRLQAARLGQLVTAPLAVDVDVTGLLSGKTALESN